jgi:L-lactate dehydrogenase complex protein LldE
LHSSCHGLRELRLDSCSERMGHQTSKVRHLLEMVPQIQLVDVARQDECCGFGGTFAVNEESVSVRMGQDRLADHLQSAVEVMAATDMSCLMHMEGIARRQKSPIQFMHIVEILAGRSPNRLQASR